MKPRAWLGGRVGVYASTYRERLRIAGLGVTLAVLVSVQHTIDFNERVAQVENERDEAQRQLAEDRALRGIPNPAIVLDARNAEQFGMRLAEIAGGLDAARAQIRK